MDNDIKTLQHELAEVESQWNQAIEANDVYKISFFMSDDWVITGTEGGITAKAAFLEWINCGDLVHHTMEFENQLVQIYGDTGVITARGTSAGTYKGDPFSFFEWSTSVYVKIDGHWKCVNTMITPARQTH